MPILRKNAAERRTGDAGGDEHRGEIGLVSAALARRDKIGDDRLRERDQAAAAKSLNDPRAGERRHARGQGASDRSDHESDHADQNDAPPPVDIGEFAVERRHHRRRDEIGGHDPGQILRIAEVRRDGRHGRDHDRLIEGREQHGEAEPEHDLSQFGGVWRRVSGHGLGGTARGALTTVLRRRTKPSRRL